MSVDLILAGDVNLMGLTDPSVPFSVIGDDFKRADLVFANLECCLFEPGYGKPDDGYYAPAELGCEALRLSGIGALGIANNVNYGSDAILSSLKHLAAAAIPVTGAGRSSAEARAPIILTCNGVRIGMLQRTAVYWPEGHEAANDGPGVATIKGHTRYRTPDPYKRRAGLPPANRPGLPPEIETWADHESLTALQDDIRRLRSHADFIIVGCHWGLFDDVLTYMREFAFAAVDAGANIVVGHGPHDHVLPIQIYGGVPILYNLGALSFRHGPNGKTFPHWIGLLARVRVSANKVADLAVEFIRQDEDLLIRKSPLSEEFETYDKINKSSREFGTILEPEGDRVRIRLPRANSPE